MSAKKYITIKVSVDVARALYSILEVILFSKFEIKFKPVMMAQLSALFDELAFLITTGGE
jgi:hypothetical protein